MMSDFPSSWKKVLLEDCMSVIIDYRGKTPRKVPFGVPLITAKIIKDGRIGTIAEYIAFEDYDTWMNRGLPQIGDVVMTTEGPLGEIAQLDECKVALGQRIITLRGYADVLDNTFLKFQMISSYVQNQLFARATGTTVQGIRQSELRKIYLRIPPLPEQQTIAHILGSLDDKIELNRQMNETLEDIARALFKSWFVDFDPVRAKMEGRQPFGMDEETARLFPDGFEDSRLGEVPKGWKITKLGSEIEILSGGTPKTNIAEYWGGVIPWVSIVDTAHSLYITQTEKTITEIGIANSSTKMLPAETIIITARGTIGNCVLLSKPMAMNQSCYGIQGKGYLGQIFLYHQIRNQINHLKVSAHGTVFDTITRSTFDNIFMVCPSVEISNKFELLARALFNQILNNQLQSQTLSTLRDTLLPKLLSGEIRVKQAEKEVEAIL